MGKSGTYIIWMKLKSSHSIGIDTGGKSEYNISKKKKKMKLPPFSNGWFSVGNKQMHM